MTIARASLRAGLLTASIATGLVATMSQAEARQSTRSFTCGALQDHVDGRGAAVLNTKSSHVYERFVRSRAFCSSLEVIEWKWVPTRSGRCGLKICRQPIGRGNNVFRRN